VSDQVGRAGRANVAPRLYDLLVHLFGIDPPVRLVGWDGSSAGTADGPTVHVLSRRAVRRLLWAPGELGLARTYVAGELDIEGDLVAGLRALAEYGALVGAKPSLSAADRREVLRTAVLLGAVGPAPKPPAEEQLLAGTGPRGASQRGARKTAATELPSDGLELMEHVLGDTLAYSGARWEGADTLDEAQRRKLDLLCDRLGLQPGARLLDVGCGWGPLLLHAVRDRGVEAVGMVRSADRAAVVRDRLAAAGLAGRADVRLGAAPAVDDGPYDAIAAIESAEDVDEATLAGVFGHVQQLLRPGGRFVLNALTSQPGGGTAGPTFMSEYVMPQGLLPPVGVLIRALEAAGLEVRLVESWREHHARTMATWLRRLDSEAASAEAVLGPNRLRVWRLSLALATVGFERGRIGLHHVVAVRPHADGRSGMLAWPS